MTLIALVFALLGPTAQRARAGAFMMPEGRGQIIAGVGYVAASHAFDRWGTSAPARSFRKTNVSLYAEYGLTPWLTLIAAPTAARMHSGWLANTYNGSDESAFGTRVRLYGTDTQVVALQALVEPPFGPRALQFAFGGPQAAATDLRLQFGQSFRIFGCLGFFDVEPGTRLRGGPWPDERRLDVTLGLRPTTLDMILLQSFTTLTSRRVSFDPGTRASKVQVSLVHDLSSRLSLQLGGIATLSGRNAARELGPLVALWMRF